MPQEEIIFLLLNLLVMISWSCQANNHLYRFLQKHICISSKIWVIALYCSTGYLTEIIYSLIFYTVVVYLSLVATHPIFIL